MSRVSHRSVPGRVNPEKVAYWYFVRQCVGTLRPDGRQFLHSVYVPLGRPFRK
jgi:hypothetical protein